jgi:hypothetical protein
MRKRFLSVLLLISLLLSYLPLPVKTEAALSTTPVVMQNVTYTYQERVKFLDFAPATRLGDTLIWTGTDFKPGDLLVDRDQQTSVKILSKMPNGSYLVANPSIYDLFSEFNIPRQEIIPNNANLTEYAVKGIDLDAFLAKQAAQAPGSGTTQTLFSANGPGLMNEIRAIFQARGTKIYEYDGTYTFKPLGSTSGAVKLALRGAMGVSPGIVAEYSLFDGYEFGFVDAAQFIELNMMFNVALDEEVYLPVFAVTVPIPGLGGVKMGIYLVVDVNGDITLTIKASEGVLATASVYGGTSFGVPTSFHTDTDFDHYFDAECDPMGFIEAGLYITPMVNLEILDVDVFGAQLRLGFFGYAHITEKTMNYGVDFVLHAFVVILDDRTDLFRVDVPILERYKSFNSADEVIFYFSRLCVYQDRLNMAAMTKRMVGSTVANQDPFSDKQAFANRLVEVWYYRSGTDAQNGTATPDQIIPVQTDSLGAASIDFSSLDVQKGDRLLLRAPGFLGQTDLIKAATPFGAEKLPGQSDFYGNSKVWADFFEEEVTFPGLSGPDLTVLSVPNVQLDFQTQKWIRYIGPVKLFSTDKTTQVTESAWILANGVDKEYHPVRYGSFNGVNLTTNLPYDVKPNHEIRWQVNVDGYIYGSYEPTGAGGHETTHQVKVHRVIEDHPVVLKDLEGKVIGIQHQVALHLVAVNKNGNKPYTGSADLTVSLGRVPEDYEQTFEKDKTIIDLGYVMFPAAHVGYPLHYEYYLTPPFPDLLYSMDQEPTLQVSVANNQALANLPLPEGAVSMAHFLWKWEERLKETPATVEREEWQWRTDPTTGRMINELVTMVVPNSALAMEGLMVHSEFNSVPVSYTYWIESPTVINTSGMVPVVQPMANETTLTNDIFQTRHWVSGMKIEGIAMDDPSVCPPAPIIYNLDELIESDAMKFDLEFQLKQMRDVDRFVTNPIDFAAESGVYKSKVALESVISKMPANIANAAMIPAWSQEYVSAVVNHEIMRLDAGGRFAVGVSTTRAEFAGAVVRALGLTEADAVRQGFPFTDVSAMDADRASMELAYQCGIIYGRSEVAFAPDATVTRQDAAAMLLRAFGLRNEGLVPNADAANLAVFKDQDAVSGYAEEGMAQAVALGFFNGYTDGTLKPQNQILNEQTAKIVWEMKLKAVK